jgi:hypothetical protein
MDLMMTSVVPSFCMVTLVIFSSAMLVCRLIFSCALVMSSLCIVWKFDSIFENTTIKPVNARIIKKSRTIEGMVSIARLQHKNFLFLIFLSRYNLIGISHASIGENLN